MQELEGDSQERLFENYLYHVQLKGVSSRRLSVFTPNRGEAVRRIEELIPNANYLVIEGGVPGVRFIVRKIRSTEHREIKATTSEFVISLQTDEEKRNWLILGFQSSLEKLFANFYDLQLATVVRHHGVGATLPDAEKFEINLSVTVTDLKYVKRYHFVFAINKISFAVFRFKPDYTD
jgi:hypothetical protein